MKDEKMHMLKTPNKTYCGKRPKPYQHTVFVNEITCEPCLEGYHTYCASLRETEGTP